jgi:protocatechuate 3,4-dioxygenase beta subunit
MRSHRPPVDRRHAIHTLGSLVGVAFLASCGGSDSSADTGGTTTPTGSGGSAGSTASANAACVATPALTEGPFFVDGGLNRSDIRTDPATGQPRPGVPLDLTVVLSAIGTGSCGPLAGAVVDMWHCDAGGVYSDIPSEGSAGQRFLRGYQVSDANGSVRFTTIYPGWYRGRAVHVHFKVRTNPSGSRGLELTSQLFFDDALSDQVYAQAPYSGRGRRDTLNASDGIYRGGGPVLLAPLLAAGGGYSGTFQVGVRV